MNLAEWAEAQNIHTQAAYCWFWQGKPPAPARRVGGLIMVGDLSGDSPQPEEMTAVYARVSSADQKADLDAQVARATAWATSNGCSVDQVVTEVGSALDGKRRNFLGRLGNPTVTAIIVEHRDRFARFGAEHVAGALDAGDRGMVVVDDGEVDDNLVRDMTELMTSPCARLDGRRSPSHQAAKAVEVATSGAAVGGGGDD